MRAIIPGRPQATPQALCTALWEGLRIVAYVSGNAVILLDGPQSLLQTIYVDDVDSLQSVVVEESSGKVAVSGRGRLLIYIPVGRDEGTLRWIEEHNIVLESSQASAALSWASPEEILIGNTDLSLWNLPHHDAPFLCWQETLPSAVRLAMFSHDASLLASCGHHDRLVKLWRRLSYEVDSTRFDASYLRHPAAVTDLHWRKPWHAEQNLDNLLYTFCSDNSIRVFAQSEPHSRPVMQQIHEIDMIASIQPRTLQDKTASNRRYGFVLDSRDFASATERTVQSSPNPDGDHAIEHLLEIARRSPEICVILDETGYISAWGLENAGYRNRMPTTIFNVIHVKGLHIQFKPSHESMEDPVRFCVFAGGMNAMSFTILVHHFHGRIDWYDAAIAHLFDSGPREDRTTMVSTWTGHSTPLEAIYQPPQSSRLLTRSRGGVGIVWQQSSSAMEPPLHRHARVAMPDNLLDVYLLDDEIIVLLDARDLTIHNVRQSQAELVARKKLDADHDALVLIPLDDYRQLPTSALFATLHGDGSTNLWIVRSREPQQDDDMVNGSHNPLELVCVFKMGIKQHTLLTTVPSFAKEASRRLFPEASITATVLTSTKTGKVQRLRADVHFEDHKATWSTINEFDTGLQDITKMLASPLGFCGFVHSNERSLSIWDSSTGCIELEWKTRDEEAIENLAWTSDNFPTPMLAIGTAYHIYVVGQMQYNYSSEQEAWVLLKQIRTRDFATHPLGDFAWLRHGDLAIGAGQQIFVHEIQTLSGRNLLPSIAIHNGSRDLFHPKCLVQLALVDSFPLIHRLILELYVGLKFHSDDEILPSTLKLSLDDILRLCGNQGTDNNPKEALPEEAFELDRAIQLLDRLETLHIEQLRGKSVEELRTVIETLCSLGRHRESLDKFGVRYSFLSQILNQDNRFLSNLRWREIVFASHSTSQEILVNQITESLPDSRLTWATASQSGMFLWLTDPVALATQMENVGRAEYTKTDDRNPVNASLYYLALRKKSVLQGLWRVCVGNREKENTVKLLSRNFNEPKWKQTALKNAYALLSKRRFDYAAAFFLLSGSLQDAVNVCVHQLGQIDLAIAIARVYEGRDDGAVLIDLLKTTVLPQAAETGNCWMATWAYQMLRNDADAIRALVRPLHEVISDTKSDIPNANVGTLVAKHWRNHEPALHMEYLYLRDKLIRANQWREVIRPKEEWNFVLRCARQYVRMGCDWLALSLLRNWKFVPESFEVSNGERPTTLVEKVELTDERKEDGLKGKREENKKPAPTQFEEPSANSLLDSFGF